MFSAKPGTALAGPSPDLILRVEDFYGIELPQDYVHFLSENNGAEPETRMFTAAGHDYLVERFLSMLDDEQLEDPAINWSDVSVVTTQIEDRLIEDDEQEGMTLIPIAQLFAGDYACLDYRTTPETPEVCVWHHEESEENAPATTPAATSFSEFLELLT